MQIMILGAGYAGLRVALDLDELLNGRSDQAQITLVDQNPYHQLIQVLHLTATEGSSSNHSAIALDRILQERAVCFKQGRVTRIAPLLHRLFFNDGTSTEYDKLIIALGAHTNYGNIPGAREHSLTLRTHDEALLLRKHIRERFAEALKTSDPKAKRQLLTFAIVGGGYTGCQFAGELAVWVRELANEYGVPRSELRVALVEGSHTLLRQFGPWATREAERVLDSRGVSVYLDTMVERVEPNALYLNEKRVLRAGTLVWAGGIQAPALLAESGLPTDEYGRVLVDRYLRVQDQAVIFAAGDCAHIPDPQNGTVPATASYAIRQGTHLAETLLDELEGRPPRAYEPLKLGEVVSLGPDAAVGDPLGVRVYGMPALLLKKGIEKWYLSTLQ